MDSVPGITVILMRSNSFLVVILILGLSVLSSCANISLSGGGKPTAVTPASSSGPADKNTQPPLQGEWEVDYEFKGDLFASTAMLSQSGAQLAGQGADQDGMEWKFNQGQVNGAKVTFTKVYMNANPPRPPVTYSGDVKYIESPEYTGWMMEGTYAAPTADGKSLVGKWVANPLQGGQAQVQEPSTANQPPPVAEAPPGGGTKSPDISGRYDVGYQYNFKKINSKMWIKQDGGKLSGDGVDTTTGEKFIVAKGWYAYPKVTIVRQYVKGKGASESRTVTFKAQVSSDGHHILMNGETQFGGHWDARLIR